MRASGWNACRSSSSDACRTPSTVGDARGRAPPAGAAVAHPIRTMPQPGNSGRIRPSDRSEREELRMSTEIPPTTSTERESPWTSGLTVFAASIMIIAGIWHALTGIAALVHDNVYITVRPHRVGLDPPPAGNPRRRRRRRASQGPDLGSCGRDRPGGPESDRQLPVPPLLPALVVDDHRARRCGHLGLVHLPPRGRVSSA